MKVLNVVLCCVALATSGCDRGATNNQEKHMGTFKDGTFGYDQAFLEKHKEIVVISSPDNPDSKAIVLPAYQGRVMTSTSNGDNGNSYGWINYKLIENGQHQPHINAFGGEERFWLSPEGGQFSVYFKKGSKFDFDNWQTPALIDTVPFEVVESDDTSVKLRVNAMIENYSGFMFVIEINRSIQMLSRKDIESTLDLGQPGTYKATAYMSVNSIINKDADWKSETGMLGVWLLGMFKPSEKTTIVAPFVRKAEKKPAITADYFGKIPADRFAVRDSVVFLKADGKSRSKIGIAPKSARNVAGSYDEEKGILTIIKFDLAPEGQYMKSTWEIHQDPYNGDALNAYNDGKLADGTQMGPFYELESNSFVKPLKEGETLTHCQRTYHFEGDKNVLNKIAVKVLGASLAEINAAFQ
jgi:hypothetical protein